MTSQRVIAARAADSSSAIETSTVRTLPSGALSPSLTEANLKDLDAVQQGIADAVATVGGRSRDVVAILPDSAVRVALLDFDTLPEKRTESDAVVRFRLKKALPFDVDHAAIWFDAAPIAENDRKKIGRIVFADAAELRALEALVFPYIEKRIAEETARARARPDVKFIILDAAIMLETLWHRQCDKIVFVDAPWELRVARLKEQRGWDEQEVQRRESVQMPLQEKKRRADATIVNDAEPEKVSRQVQVTLEQWKVI